MSNPPSSLDGCVIVMAHPDDELLWASSLLHRAARVILCFGAVAKNPTLSAGRELLAARYPLPTARFLAIPESAVFGRARWPDPRATAEGLEIVAAPARARDYRRSFADLLSALPPQIEGARTIVTHNPWGEYGHEHHVQVLRALETLQPRFGFDILVSCYAAPRALGLMARSLGRLGTSTGALPTDPGLADSLRRLYLETGTWTWFADYRWPETECFLALRPAGTQGLAGTVLPLNMIDHPFEDMPFWQREGQRYGRALLRRLGATGR